ncbi:hypothetical protein DXG01_000441 [Tephrocybe rancida]|nr:hypothetical protein DXG01_000441 [Tephrocybe rancida]
MDLEVAVSTSHFSTRRPLRFTAPFSILGDEAKLAFPSQAGGITKLATTRYFVLFDSASDVFSLITPHHIRRALLDAPENVATLIRVVAVHLFSLLTDHTFPSTSNASVAAFASSFIKPGLSDRNTTKEVLNCLRILERVLPVVFEVDGELNTFELEVLWKKEEVEIAEESNGTSEDPQFVIEDDDDSEGEHDESTPKSAQPKPKSKQQLPSLGERLFSSTMDLLFCCGFTLPPSLQVDHHKINYIIWEKGVGSTTDPGSGHAYDSNRTEVLRLLLILLSRQIYVPSGSLFTHPSLYSLYLVQQIPRRDVLTLLCSLLNTAMNSSTSHDTSIGGMAGSVAGKLPYNHLVFKGGDPRSTLVSTCFQVLCVLLDFQSGKARDTMVGTGDPAPTARTNTFRYFLMKLHRSQDFDFIIEGVAGIFEQQMATMNNLLPGARKSVPYISETIAYLLCYALEIKDKPQQHGLCRALSYIIQTLSAEPGFGLKLTKPVKPQLPAKWNAAGTAADFMVNAIYAIVATTSGTLNSLYPALLIALANSAPHFKDLTVTASTRLIQLFKSFSNPLFLLADEGHPRLLFFMLEAFNSVILHHLTDNANLIYGILSSHKVFEDLGTFTLARGLREIKRVQQAKEEQARKAEGNLKGKAPSGPDENADPGAEKARLLENEGGAGFPAIQSAENLPGTPRLSEEQGDGSEVVTQSFMSPGSETPTRGSFAAALSEKARGKMRERRPPSLDVDVTIDRVAAAGIGRNGFVPTQEWVILPLDPVMLLISELLPQVQELQATRHKANATSVIVEFLSKVSLKHVLPEAPAPLPRRFMWSDASIVWLTSLIWGEIYSAVFKRGNLTDASEIMISSSQDIARKCKTSAAEAQAIIDALYRCAPQPGMSRLKDAMLDGNETSTTGDPILDGALGGGIRSGMIWEVAGEASAGKTQFALQLSLCVQLSQERKGLFGSTCYITTSSTLETKRLVQMMETNPSLSGAGCDLNDIQTLTTPTIPHLIHVLSEKLTPFIDARADKAGSKPVKLLVIDALAELFHTSDKTTTNTLVERSKNIAHISFLLHTLAKKHRLVVLILNEVVDVFDRAGPVHDEGQTLLYSEQSRWFGRAHSLPGENKKEASLGMVWANQVNTRILLSRTDRRRYLDDSENASAKRLKTADSSVQSAPVQAKDDPLRRLSVIFSSVSQPISLDYIITDAGISILSEDDASFPEDNRKRKARSIPAILDKTLPAPGLTNGGALISPLDMGTAEDAPGEISQSNEEEESPEDEWDEYWTTNTLTQVELDHALALDKTSAS